MSVLYASKDMEVLVIFLKILPTLRSPSCRKASVVIQSLSLSFLCDGHARIFTDLVVLLIDVFSTPRIPERLGKVN